ncbi:MAG: tRNA dihydrouridine synthase DusB [Candidatus Marinimicrobia bacterium]|nr:tRNA dihydrouridine synthase DusB [Candidatus Neomarinimicrobiota bacterium]MBL7059574.1 tRNA dihydrouridine synthase DusB [Candidatus Neomarinimicrobiota bacterium]
MLTIGNIKLPNPIILAPMAGVTDTPFRRLCKEQGAGVVYSEFVSAHGIIRENEKTLEMIRFTPFERPIGVQIFGDDPSVMGKAAKFVADKFQPDILDINYGCPVPKVTKKGAGSAALKDLVLMEDITAAVVEAVPDIPVTVKMRSGWSSNSIVIPKAGELLENAGVKAITLHPRTTKQGYTGTSDWSMIKTLKQAVSIPVIGNGDVTSVNSMHKMLGETGCDGIMIGRAALGNPWIFRELNVGLKNELIPPPPTLEERIAMCRRHLDLLVESRGEHVGSNLMRKHFGWYLKGFPGAAAVRKSLVTAPDIQTMQNVLGALFTNTTDNEKRPFI